MSNIINMPTQAEPTYTANHVVTEDQVIIHSAIDGAFALLDMLDAGSSQTEIRYGINELLCVLHGEAL
jgi:hypothetical protein